MSDSLEAELDGLFQLPAAQMVAARNALVSRLKKAGQREAAAQVSALKRPAPAAWAINQIFFQQRALLEHALAEVARVRELQAMEGLDRQQLAAAVAAQRVALQAVVDAALRNLAAAGLPNAGPNERRVFATVQGWLGGSGDEAPGRMTRELEPSGFESVGVLGIPAPLPAAGAAPLSGSASSPLPVAGGKLAQPGAAGDERPFGSAASPPRAAGVGSLPPSASSGAGRAGAVPTGANLSLVPSAAPDPEALARRAREQAEARVFERKQSFEWAEGRSAEQRKKQAVAEQAVERAKHEVEDAERALALRRAALSDRQTELSRRQQDVADADRARDAAEAALKEARAELAKLQL